MLFHPLIQTSSRYFSRLKRVCRTQTLTSTEHHISSLHSHLWVQLSAGNAIPQPDKNDKLLRFFIIIIKEYGSTLYVGLARAVPPANTKFQPLLLPTQRVCRTQTLTNTEHHISSLHSHLWVQLSAGSSFPKPDKNGKFLRFFIIITIIKIFSTISSDEIPPRSACKYLQNLYQSLAIHLKYVLLVLLLRLLMYLGL